MQAEPIPGSAVTLPATIASMPFFGTGVAPERQTIHVRLRDGQTIETNFGNIDLPEQPPEQAPAKETPPTPPVTPETPAQP